MYISTVVFRPGSQGDKVTPARAVGLTWLPLARETRKLKVAINAPAQVEPEKRMVAKLGRQFRWQESHGDGVRCRCRYSQYHKLQNTRSV